tara:strand:+ start:87 stop:398 length:312 start_codon:yes stop_codon:yes gene_type:complete
MSSFRKTFEGKFSIYLNTVGKVVLKADEDGKFEAKDAKKAAEKVVSLAKELKAIPYFFAPEKPYGTKGYSPVILHKGGTPYIAILSDANKPSVSTRSKVVKLA